MYLAHDNKCPALLVALAKDPQLYEEARHIYLQNANVTLDNEKAFRRTSLFNLGRIKHLKVVLPLRFQAQIITLKNNLMSLTIDLAGVPTYDWPGSPGELRFDVIAILQLLLPASKELQRLAIKLEGETTEKEIAEVVKGFRFAPVREVLQDGALLCTWETHNGAPLSVAGKVWHRLVFEAERAAMAANSV